MDEKSHLFVGSYVAVDVCFSNIVHILYEI